MRDKQIFTRVSQETYDWVTIQAAGAGVSRGAAVAAILDQQAQCGAVLVATRLEVVHRDGDPRNNAPGNLEVRENKS